MRNLLVSVLFAGLFASGCFIVTEDKPVNSAPTTTTATASATAAPTAPSARPKLRRAPPPVVADGGM
jgi:hypothetical protein